MADIKLLTAVSAANGLPPAGATVGIPLRGAGATGSSAPAVQGMRENNEAVVLVVGTGGVTTPTVTLRLWGFSGVSNSWHVLKNLNAAGAIGLVGADTVIRYSEVLTAFTHFDRIYCEVVAVGGATPPATSVWLISRWSPKGTG